MKSDQSGGDEMDDLYSGSIGSEDKADTSKDTSGDQETVDQEDEEESAQSSVVPMSMLEGKDGEPVKRGDVIKIKVMDVYGGTDVKICRADAWGGEKSDQEEEAAETPEEEMSEDEELEKMGNEY